MCKSPTHLGSEPSNPERREQFLTLYSEHYTRLLYYHTALVPVSNDAADIMQETSLVLWRKFDSFEVGTNFFAWACKIARLQTLKYYQRNKRFAYLFDTEVLEKVSTDAIASASQNIIRLEALESCIKELPIPDRQIVRRRYETGVTAKRLAGEVGLSVDRLSRSLARIRKLLLNCIDQKEAECA